MTIDQVVFAVVFVVALGSSIAMLFAPNAVHVALFLVAGQIALALAFLLEGAFFVAAVQVIVYAGAIMVLFLFVIMLLGVDRREVMLEPLRGQRPLALGLGALLAVEVMYVANRGFQLLGGSDAGGQDVLQDVNRDPGNVVAIARRLFGTYLLPFEVTSVLLVVAIVGTMVLARRIASLGPPVHEARTADESEAAA